MPTFVIKLLLMATMLGVGVYAAPARMVVLVPEPNPAVATGEAGNKDALGVWIDRLEEKELDFRHGRELCIIDVNGLESCGCLQFQRQTFDTYAHLAGAPTSTEIYKDCRMQKKVAHAMILDDYENWRHWSHSVEARGLGLPPKAEGGAVQPQDKEYAISR